MAGMTISTKLCRFSHVLPAYLCPSGDPIKEVVMVDAWGQMIPHTSTDYAVPAADSFVGDGAGFYRSYFTTMDGVPIADADRPVAWSYDPSCNIPEATPDAEFGCIINPDDSTVDPIAAYAVGTPVVDPVTSEVTFTFKYYDLTGTEIVLSATQAWSEDCDRFDYISSHLCITDALGALVKVEKISVYDTQDTSDGANSIEPVDTLYLLADGTSYPFDPATETIDACPVPGGTELVPGYIYDEAANTCERAYQLIPVIDGSFDIPNATYVTPVGAVLAAPVAPVVFEPGDNPPCEREISATPRCVWACPDGVNYLEVTELREVTITVNGQLVPHGDTTLYPDATWTGSTPGSIASYLTDVDGNPIPYADYPQDFSCDKECGLPECTIQVGCAVEVDADGAPVVPANTVPACLKICEAIEVAADDGTQCMKSCSDTPDGDAFLSMQMLEEPVDLTQPVSNYFTDTDANGLPTDSNLGAPTNGIHPAPTIYGAYAVSSQGAVSIGSQGKVLLEGYIRAPKCELEKQGRSSIDVSFRAFARRDSRVAVWMAADGNPANATLLDEVFIPGDASNYASTQTITVPADGCFYIRMYILQGATPPGSYTAVYPYWDLVTPGTLNRIPVEGQGGSVCPSNNYVEVSYEDTAGDGAFNGDDGSGPLSAADITALGGYAVDCETGVSLAFSKELLDSAGGVLDAATYQWDPDCNLYDGEVTPGCFYDAAGNKVGEGTKVDVVYVATGEIVNTYYLDALNAVFPLDTNTFGSCSSDKPLVEHGCLWDEANGTGRQVTRSLYPLGADYDYANAVIRDDAGAIVTPTADESFTPGPCGVACPTC